MRALDEFGRIAADGDDDRRAIADAEIEMCLQLVFRKARREIDRDRADAGAGIRVAVERVADAGEPSLELLETPPVLPRQARDQTGLARFAHKVWPADEEHRRADRRQSDLCTDFRIKRHRGPHSGDRTPAPYRDRARPSPQRSRLW